MGEVYRLPARGKGHEQRGRRYAFLLQPDWLALSTWLVAFTSTSARQTSFRPSVEIGGCGTLVMCDEAPTGADDERLEDFVGRTPEIVSWITWADVDTVVVRHLSSLATEDLSLCGSVDRLAAAVSSSIATHS